MWYSVSDRSVRHHSINKGAFSPFFFALVLLCGPLFAERLDIVTFNVQNLYDTVDDPRIQDETWLPQTVKWARPDYYRRACDALAKPWWRQSCMTLNWAEPALAEKIKRLVEVVKQRGSVPDVLALQEVENIKVLNRLADAFGDAYPTRVLIPGRDRRGINVALLSRLPLEGEPMRLAAPGGRGMLRVDLQNHLTLIVVHFPSPMNTTERRQRAWERLQTAAAQVPAERGLIALGDFNFPVAEEGLLRKLAVSNWLLASDECDRCRGTYYYQHNREWSRLDRILLRRNRDAGWRFCDAGILSGLEIQHSANRTPQGFVVLKGTFKGVSDHWPLHVCLSGPQ